MLPKTTIGLFTQAIPETNLVLYNTITLNVIVFLALP